jgi:hypothetical protein
MEAVGTSGTSVNYQISRRRIPEDSHLHTRRLENLKSHQENKIIPPRYKYLIFKTPVHRMKPTHVIRLSTSESETVLWLQYNLFTHSY